MAKHNTTLKGEASLREIFRDRTNPLLGLTKLELISIYHKIPLRKVLNMKKDNIDKLWDDISYVRKALRKEKLMAIIQIGLDRGVVLTDYIDGLGNRELKSRTVVYYRSIDMDSANQYRARLNKNAMGMIQAGEQVVNIVDEQITQEPVLQVINQKN